MKVTNRVLAVLVALALLVISVLAIVEIVWVLALGGSTHVLVPYQPTADYLAELTWDSITARAILAGLVIVGILLIAAELRRRKPGLLTLASSGGPVSTGADRRSLQKAAAAAATDVDGISSARARVSRRRIRISATAGLHDARGLQDQLTDHMRSWVDGLGLASPPTLSVQLAERRST